MGNSLDRLVDKLDDELNYVWKKAGWSEWGDEITDTDIEKLCLKIDETLVAISKKPISLKSIPKRQKLALRLACYFELLTFLTEK